MSVREGRGETAVPLFFSHDCPDDGPPQMRPLQLEWYALGCCRSWTGQELPLEGLYSSTFLLMLGGYPPEMRKPGIINNCHNSEHEALQVTMKGEYLTGI